MTCQMLSRRYSTSFNNGNCEEVSEFTVKEVPIWICPRGRLEYQGPVVHRVVRDQRIFPGEADQVSVEFGSQLDSLLCVYI
jgi:hypothetical protein